MTIRIDYRGKGIGRYLELDEQDWKIEKFGFLNNTRSGELTENALEELEELSRELEYGEDTNGFLEGLAQRLYGGAIQTPSGTREWIGEIPDDVEEYLEEVRGFGIM